MRILITGGTGSLGNALVPLLLAGTSADRIIIYSRDEQKQQEMAARLPDSRMVYMLGDVRDRERLAMAMHGVDTVIHAAALKIVPRGEFDPSEFVKTNIIGADNVIHAALAAGVSRVLAISTDKAVAPVNLYGATKLAAEKLFVAANAYRRFPFQRFAVVRYGNVAGSRGSVIPLWRAFVASGRPLPVTAMGMTRFWITLPEAAHVVLQALEGMTGGEVFVPKMPAFRLEDLMVAFGTRVRPVAIGMRPGEKLHEDLITVHESTSVHETDNVFVIVPHGIKPGNPVPSGWRYASNSTGKYLTVDELRERLAHV